MKRTAVYLTVSYGRKKGSARKLLTNYRGIARFSLNTEPWGLEQVSLQVGQVSVSPPGIPACSLCSCEIRGTSQVRSSYLLPSLLRPALLPEGSEAATQYLRPEAYGVIFQNLLIPTSKPVRTSPPLSLLPLVGPAPLYLFLTLTFILHYHCCTSLPLSH